MDQECNRASLSQLHDVCVLSWEDLNSWRGPKQLETGLIWKVVRSSAWLLGWAGTGWWLKCLLGPLQVAQVSHSVAAGLLEGLFVWRGLWEAQWRGREGPTFQSHTVSLPLYYFHQSSHSWLRFRAGTDINSTSQKEVSKNHQPSSSLSLLYCELCFLHMSTERKCFTSYRNWEIIQEVMRLPSPGTLMVKMGLIF